jgi:hypothetical protein
MFDIYQGSRGAFKCISTSSIILSRLLSDSGSLEDKAKAELYYFK